MNERETPKTTKDFPELTNAWVLQTGFCWEVASRLQQEWLSYLGSQKELPTKKGIVEGFV